MKNVRNLLLGMLLVVIASPSQAQQQEYAWMFDEGEGNTVTDTTENFTSEFGVQADLPEISEDSPSGSEGDLSVIPTGGFEVDDSEDPVLDLQEGPFTAEVWVKPIDLTGNQDFFRIGNSLKAGFTGENLLFTLLGIVDVDSGVPIPIDDAWHHVAYVWDPGVDVTFYLDGEEVAVIPEEGAARDFENDLMSIGSAHDGASTLQANMDRLRIHNAVLGPEELDSDPSAVADNLDSTVVAYSFDESEWPYESSTDVDRPAFSMNEDLVVNSIPEFSTEAPSGEEGDYSLSFDGNDRVTYDDNIDWEFDIFDESFTFQLWLKFNSDEQVVPRPVFLSYGVGGEGGYSFSFRLPNTPTASAAPSGLEEDSAVQLNGGLHVDTEGMDEDVMSLREGPVTFESWVYHEDTTGYQDIIRIGNSLKAGFNGENLLFTFLGVVDMNTEVAVPAEEWHHIAYAWEPGVGVTFYLDGEEAQFVADDRLPDEFGNSNISIGSNHGDASLFQGQIDRFKAHSAVLTAEQLDSNAAEPADVLDSTILSYSFDEESTPYSNAVDGFGTAQNSTDGNLLTVTTYGILDVHSEAEIPDDGMWHHVAVALDFGESVFRFYVDGEVADVVDYDDTVNLAPEDGNFLRFGSEGSGNFYVGLLDSISINRGVVAQEDLDYFEPVETPVAEWSLY